MLEQWVANPRNQRWAAALALTIAILCVYYPVLTYHYLYHDDWMHFSSHGLSCSASPMYSWSRVTGRLIGQYVLCGLFDVFGTIDQAWLARLIVVCGIALFAWLQAIYFRALRLSWLTSVSLALGASLLPGLLAFGFWITAGSIIFAYLASVTAVLATDAALRYRQRIGMMTAMIAGACALQITALSIHQTAAMYFWTLTAVMLATKLSSGLRTAMRPLVLYGAVGASPMLGYFIWFKYISGLGASLSAADPRRGTMFADMTDSFKWFCSEALPRASSLWFFEESDRFGATILAFLILLLVLASARAWRVAWKRGDRTESHLCAIYPLAIAALAILVFLPTLVTTFRLLVFRTLTPLSALIFLTAIVHFGILVRAERWPSVIKLSVAITGSLGLCCFAANLLLGRMVVPAAAEASFARASLLDAVPNNQALSKVRVVVPKRTRPFTTDEFDNLSAWFPHDAEAMFQTIGRELGVHVDQVFVNLQGEPLEKDAALIVDFTNLTKSGLWTSLTMQEATARARPVLLWILGDYDLVAFGGAVYGIPRSQGWVNWGHTKIENLPGVIVGTETTEVLGRLRSQIVVDPQPRLLRSQRGYNLVSYRGSIYAVPQSLGPLNDWGSVAVGKLPGVIVGSTVDEVLARLPR